MIKNGVSIDGQHCYKDLGLILESKKITPGEPQTTFIDIPGRNGSLDLTDSATGDVSYGSTQIELVFITCNYISGDDWTLLLTKVAEVFHGKKVQIIFDEDQEYYYLGRCQINDFETSCGKQTITVVGTCDTYKYAVATSAEPWRWDPFSFVDGVARSTDQIDISSPDTWQAVVVSGYVYTDTIEIICTNTMTMLYDDVEYELVNGSNIMYEMKLKEGYNTLYFKGTGSITLVIRGGRF